jgi:hypothetical protein
MGACHYIHAEGEDGLINTFLSGSCEVMIGLVVMLAFKIALQVVHTDCFTAAFIQVLPFWVVHSTQF